MNGIGWGQNITAPISNLPQLPNLSFPTVSMPGVETLTPYTAQPLTPLRAKTGLEGLNLVGQNQGQTGWFGNFKDQMGGWGGMAKFGLDAVTGLGELWAANEALKLSKDQFEWNKKFAQQNMDNTTQTYNTRLADRANARAVMQGQSDAERDAYIAANRLPSNR